MKNLFLAALKKPKRTLYWQVAFTLFAFAAMVIISYFIMRAVIHNYLAQNTQAALDLAQTRIEVELRGPETTLRAFAESAQQWILQGSDADSIRTFLHTFDSHLSFYSKDGNAPIYLFGIFYTLGPEPVFMHSNNWNPPADFDSRSRPWYQAAVAGGGQPTRSQMYVDMSSNQYVFAIAQSIMDETGRLLAVVCLQVPFSLLGEIVINTAKEQGGYGIILSHNLKVLSHQNPGFVGMDIPNPALSFSIFLDSFIKGEDIFERPLTNFVGEESLAFFRKTQDGWYYGMIVPRAPYYKSITIIWYALIASGIAAAVFLIFILVSTDAKKNRATALTNILNKMSEIFLTQSGKTFEDIMNAGGKLLVDLIDIDRFSIFRNSQADGKLYMSQIYRWEKASGGTTNINNKFYNIPYGQTVPAWEDSFAEGRLLNGPVHLMSERTATFLKSLGMVSAFGAPIYINGAPWGFALYEDHTKERVFDDDLAETMRSAAFLFANAFMRAELEHRLASERDFTQSLIDAAPMGLNIWDECFNLVSCNDAIQNIFGCTKQYYIDNFYKLSPEYQPDGVRTDIKVKELLNRASNNETVVLEYMHCSVTGEPIPCEITITRVDYNNTSVVLVYLYDLRNLKKMEKAILDAKQAQALIDATPLCCTLTDKNLNVLTCNKSAVEFFKLSKKENIQFLYDDLMPEYQPDGSNSKKTATELIRKAFDDGYVFIPEWTHKSTDGELLPCEVTLVRVEYGGDQVIAGYNRDLRAEKEAEAKTREADERAQLMIEYAPFIVALWNKDGQILDCNQEAVRVFGLSSKKEYMDTFFEHGPKYQPNGMTTQEMFTKARLRIFNETEYAQLEWVHNHAVTGEAIPLNVTLVRIKYKDGYVALSYGQDLRELKASIAKMREADERAQIMFETAPLASFMADKDGNLVDCNQEILKMFGLPDKEFYFNTAPKLLPEYQPNGELSFAEVVRNNRIAFEKGYNRFEWDHLRLNGESLPAEVILVRVKYRGENAIAGYIRDLTEQKAAEHLTKIITEKTSTLTAIFNSTPDMMFCKDSNLLFTECNKAMENYFGIRQSDIAGKPELEALNIPPEIAVPLLARDKRVITERRAITSEELIKSFDGRMVHFEMIRAPLIQEGKVIGIVGIARDITQRKEIEQLAKQQAEAEAANRAKSSFLATMSHEMRTPMNAILGITEIQLQNEELSPDTKDALHIIHNSGYSLLGVLNNLLDLSKIEANKLELINDRYEMANLINDVVNLNITGIGSKPIEFNLHVDEDMPFELIGDELRVKQILNNLLSNAFKYTDSGEVRLSFSAKINGDENATDGNTYVTLIINILDTGQGMTEAQIQDMFDAYSRFNLKMNRLVEGTGLGMSIVQQLVNKMDGDIAVNSIPGKGTEVTVHLKQGYADPTKIGKELAKNLMNFRLTNTSKMKKAHIVREPMPYGRVLVVDDMETNLYVAKGFLLPYGLIVDTALSGMEAIEKIEHGNEYDIVFMDHMMPKMDGVEAVQIMREKGYTRPIVALTANAVSGQAEMFMANGFDGFISKPIDIRELNSSLNKFVRDRHTPEEIEAARAAYNGSAVADDAVPQSDPGLAKIFARDAEKAIAALQEYEDRNTYGSDDLQMYILNVHALKSALANIGETKLSGLARELEQAGRDQRIAFISEKTSAFLGELRAVVDKLKPDAEEYGAGDVSDEDKVYLRKMLLTVKEACAAYDKKAAKAALTELKQKPWPLSYSELLDSIAEYLLHSDFDEAEAACEDYLSDKREVNENE